MENASKALIIAGAILLSIVLITLGVLIIGRGQEAVDQTNIDDQVISSWNQKFLQYEGSNVTGTTVNTMINAVLSANVTSNNNGQKERLITITPGSTGGNNITVNNAGGGTSQVTKKATPTAKYSVTTSIDTTTGYINKITVTAK